MGRSLERIDDLTIAIQAGGESKRMGTSKALVPFLDEPLIMRPINRLFPICNEMIITTNEPEKMGFLDGLKATGRLFLVSDNTETRGALIGMRTALSSASNPYVALVACDMISPSPDLFIYLYSCLLRSDADVAIPYTKYGFEPFHAIYRRSNCLKAVEKALAAGDQKATSWFNEVSLLEVGHEEIVSVNPSGGAFVNVNTPVELRALEQKLSRAAV